MPIVPYGYLGLDRKAAIDKDVYHITRLGLNAYRIHLWDVELTDEQGNVLENEPLDLLDISDCQTQGTEHSYCYYRPNQFRKRLPGTEHSDRWFLL